MKKFILILIIILSASMSWADVLTLGRGSDEAEATYINTFAQTTNYGSNITLEIYDANRSQVTLIKWGNELTTPITGTTISSATLTIKCAGSADPFYGHVFQLKRDWVELEATWLLSATGVGWGTDGCQNTSTDFDPTEVDSVDFTGLNVGDDTVYDVTPIVQAWADGDPNYGFLLKGSSSFGSNTHFNSDNHGTAGNRPQLSVTYTTGETISIAIGDGISISGGVLIE